jgi:hypothetical protein
MRALRPAARVALGLFILWQLWFLLTANFVGLAQDTRDSLQAPAAEVVEELAPGWTSNEGAAHKAAAALTAVTERWAQLTGQWQGWSLFAPDLGDECPFPVVELRWDEAGPWEVGSVVAALGPGRALGVVALAGAVRPGGPGPARDTVLLPSPNEPADPQHYFRLGHFRLRRFEGWVTPVLARRADEAEVPARARWLALTDRHLRREWPAVRAYLRWRTDEYLRDHPGRPAPRQVILHVRRYHIAAPQEAGPSPWDAPESRPVARWRPGRAVSPEYLPVEMYNPVPETFEWLRR